MPPLTRWLVRTALCWLVAALVLGAAMQSAALRHAVPALAAAWPAYVHLLVVGWITGLIFGVAWWLFPRVGRGPASDGVAGWLVWGLLNGGLLLRALVEPVVALDPGAGSRWVLPVSAAAQLGAVALFTWMIWPRVRGR